MGGGGGRKEEEGRRKIRKVICVNIKSKLMVNKMKLHPGNNPWLPVG